MNRTIQRPAQKEWALLVLGLCVFLLQAWFSALGKSPSSDAVFHQRFGETLLGRPEVCMESLPPDNFPAFTAVQVWCARQRACLDPVLGTPTDRYEFPGSTVTSLKWTRFPGMLAGVLLLFFLWLAAWRYLGPGPAFAALWVGVFSPNLLGHARFFTSDIPATLGFFAGVFTLAWVLEHVSVARLLVLASVLALAQLFKVMNLFLYPICIAAVGLKAAWDAWKAGVPVQKMVGAAMGKGLVAALVFALVFLPVIHLACCGVSAELNEFIETGTVDTFVKTYGGPYRWVRPLLPPAYMFSLALGHAHNTLGHPAYLMGEYRQHGWILYFPKAMAVKMPLPVLAAALIGLVAVFFWRRMRYIWIFLGGSAVYLVVLMFLAHVNIGVRHALPVFPAVFLLAGIGIHVVWRRSAILAAIFPVWILANTALIFPHHAEFFNLAAGGSENGWRYLLDSNLDWGQDRGLMQRWASAQKRPVSIAPDEPTCGLVVINANKLIGITPGVSK